MGTPTLCGWSHNPQVDSQLHAAGNFWILRDQPRNLPFPDFILFIPTSSSCLDIRLKRAGMPSGSSLYPKVQHESGFSTTLWNEQVAPKDFLPLPLPSSLVTLHHPESNSKVLFSLESCYSQTNLALYLCCSMTHTSCR